MLDLNLEMDGTPGTRSVCYGASIMQMPKNNKQANGRTATAFSVKWVLPFTESSPKRFLEYKRGLYNSRAFIAQGVDENRFLQDAS